MSSKLDDARSALRPRYDVQRQLGRGAVATVFLADDTERNRQVAIKVLKPELSGGIVGDRFHREIRILHQLDHAGILPVLDSGEAGRIMYFTMPYADGGTLRDQMDDRGTHDLDELLELLGKICPAIDHAHGEGFIHRDIKPENVVFSNGRPMICDFGVARAMIRAAGDTISTSGLVVGTPSYMSPEQARGEDNLDHRTDIYSLGCLAYELLTGEPPFTGRTVQAIMARQVNDPPPPLESRRPDLPDEVDAVLRQTLAKERDARPVTAGRVREGLEHARRGDR